jgi:histidyl-tRNA synthetase
VGEASAGIWLRAGSMLRADGLAVRVDTSTRSLGRQLDAAARVGATWAVIVGDRPQHGVLKELASGEQRAIPLTEVARVIGTGDAS